jgi:hypothetical protein
MARPKNMSLYKRVKTVANAKFGFLSSAHKSSWIVREYKKRGGKYIGSKPKNSGLKEWYSRRQKRTKRSSHKSQRGKRMKGGCDAGMCMIGGQNESTPRHQCPECNRPFKRSTQLRKHIIKHMKPSVIMPKPKVAVANPTPRESGRRMSYASGKNEKCPFCPKKSTVNAITQHIQNMHLSNESLAKKNDYDKLDESFFESLRQMSGESQKGTGKVYSQYYGKRSSVMIPVPRNIQKLAQYAYKLRKLGFKGGLETGWKRAKQLSTKERISIIDARYMYAWFKRHIHASYPSFKEWNNKGRPKTSQWHRKHGILSWVLWGANAGFNWINSSTVIKKINKYFNKNYKKITLNKR